MAYSNANNADYTKSNNEEHVRPVHVDGRYYTALLNAGESSTERAKLGQALLNHLCDAYHITPVKLTASVAPRPRKVNERGKSETHGFYKHCGMLPIGIVVFNTTAVKQQVVSIKRFTETLLHEFIHHYDIHVLRLTKTLHTAGFYKRISDLEALLAGK